MADLLKRNASGREWVDKMEDHADLLVRKTRRYLPHVARLCLVSTFIEDGIRLIMQWNSQIEHIKYIWKVPLFLSAIFILFNMVAQFVGSALVLSRYRVDIGVAVLAASIILQTIGYTAWQHAFLMRNLSLIGSLLLLLAEAKQESKSILAGLPSTGENAPRQYLLLGGRILIILMFLTMIHLGGSIFYLLQSAANLVLMILVAIGYKTKLCATVLVLWLTCMNFYYNQFWAAGSDSVMWDFLKYDFFQIWSVIGGLGLIVAYGPGGVSVDDYKKKW